MSDERPTVDPAVVIGHMLDLLVHERDAATQRADQLARDHDAATSVGTSSVDEHLLTDLVTEISHSYGVSLTLSPGYMRAVLDSHPFQRLRAAWTTEVASQWDDSNTELRRQRDQYADQWETAVRERDDARAERDRANDFATQEQSARIKAELESDEARATKDMHKERQQELEAELDHARLAGKIAAEDRDWCRQVGMPRMAAEVERLRAIPVVPVGYRDIAQDVVRALNNAGQFGNDVVDTGRWWPGKAVRDLLAEVEQLRAAQLPDVGPVTRRSKWGSEDLEVDGVTATSENGAASYREGAEKTLRLAARQFAVAAFLDAEAAAPDNDDEVDEVVHVLASWGMDDDDNQDRLMARELIEALDAHRARSAEGGVTA